MTAYEKSSLGVYYARVIKHGGSMRISIHPALRRAINLRLGDLVAIKVQGEGLYVKKALPPFDERKST